MIGVLGAGQLGRMLALAGYPLGQRFRFLDPAHEAPVKDLAEFLRADFSDADALERFASGLEVITYEFENIPLESVLALEHDRRIVHPGSKALRITQERSLEKTFVRGADHIWLIVRDTNARAQAVYTSLGFARFDPADRRRYDEAAEVPADGCFRMRLARS